MRVMIIGAGMGGLVLAHALHRADIDVTVHDRDTDAATGGYRLALDGRACAILRRHLTPEHYQALQASSMPSETNHGLTFADHRLRALSVATWDSTEEALLIGRVPLRRLLAEGLGERVRFTSAFVRHEIRADGSVVAHFADGSSEVADVLVGADGAGSRVAAALAGRATSASFGFGGLAARTPLDAATQRRLPKIVDGGAVLAIGPDGAGIFMTRHDAATRAAVDPAACHRIAPITEAPALIWSLIALDAVMPPEATRALRGPALIELALRALRGWPRDLRAIVAAADPDSAAYYPFNAADPDTELTPWPAGPVTALGDAVHAMPPTAGRAASTAIRDADHLATELIAARDGTTTIALATLRFHKTMATYAPDAVRESLVPLRWMRRLSHPLAGGVARVAMPAAAALHRVRQAA
ncbi:FAD-dependent oxidoreductase [Catenuloplanes atrovinosus]|uniref:2-polyprenyl-6-methoxyphenol hydroxylase-like FAD-dependent oxidoreductase n=1 Tax=Catenuloplanes atrovinosus TaxID=137266 RepID=A0AAE3YRB3_9ACTN|nr:NAD(P)/FAD-dependent oxidoreductase [Catenuloplanes atrovinosus]MDR7277216.1 2-polyprenyl-6-methoxyphenol hydroxylase-like FAD-dependent oxidoreductase [Catenuloplanes atrovinosus]